MGRRKLGGMGVAVACAAGMGCDPMAPPPPTPAEVCSKHKLDQPECAAKVRAFLAPRDPIDGKPLEWRFVPGSLNRAGWRPMQVVQAVGRRAHEVTPAEVAALKPGLAVQVGEQVALSVGRAVGHDTTFAVPPEHPDAALVFDVLGAFMAKATPRQGGRLQVETVRNPDDHTLEVTEVRRIVRWLATSSQEMALEQALQEDPGVQVDDELLFILHDPPPERVADGLKHWLARHAPTEVKRLPHTLVDLQRLKPTAEVPGAMRAGTATLVVDGVSLSPRQVEGADCVSFQRSGNVDLSAHSFALQTDTSARPPWKLQLRFGPDNTLQHAGFIDPRGRWTQTEATVPRLERTTSTLAATVSLRTKELGRTILEVELDCSPELSPVEVPQDIVELVAHQTDRPVVPHPSDRDLGGVHRAVQAVVPDAEAAELRDRLRTVLPSGWHAYIGERLRKPSLDHVAVVVAPAERPSDLVRLAEVTPNPNTFPTAAVAHLVDELDARYGLVIDRANTSVLDAHFVHPPDDPAERAVVMATMARFCPQEGDPADLFPGNAFSCWWD